MHVSQSIRRSQLHPPESAAISGDSGGGTDTVGTGMGMGMGSLEEDEKVLVLLVF